tara:strand:+ start:1229 stop:1570 length:342 start_codon:yes stop_codon:yes gene_type:complete
MKKNVSWNNTNEIKYFNIEEDTDKDALPIRFIFFTCDSQLKEWRKDAKKLRESYHNNLILEENLSKELITHHNNNIENNYINRLIDLNIEQMNIIDAHEELCKENGKISNLRK